MTALWVAVAYVLGLLAARLGLPPLVGYLGAGFALGAAGVAGGEALHQLAHAGLLLLLFTVGLKVEFKTLLRKEVLGVGGLHLALTTGLFTLFLWPVQGWPTAGLLAVCLAFASTVLTAKVLEANNELAAFHGRVAIGILVLQDLVAVGLLAVVGIGEPSPWAVALLLLPLTRPLLGWLLAQSGHAELQLLFGVGLALAGGALGHAVGLSPELGALALGAVLASHPRAAELGKQLWGLKETFLVAFFLQFGLAGLPRAEDLPWLGLLLLLLPVQGALFFLLFVRFGLRARTSFVTALSLSTYSEFALVTAGAAITSGQLAATWGPLLAAVVALSLAFVAPLNRLSHGLYTRWERYLQPFERRIQHPDVEPTELGGARWLIVGMGRTGLAAYRWLAKQGEPVLGFDSDPTRLARHQQEGRNVLYGDAEDPTLWSGLPLAGLRGVLLTLPELEAKLFALEALRRAGFTGQRAVSSYHDDDDERLTAAGATLVFHPFSEAGERLAERVVETTR